MAFTLPITLSGDNLGKRHKQINDLVNEAFNAGEFKNIENIPEKSAIDRLIKIDLASKYKDVDFITKNLKNSDMLYVSRALKSKWLIKSKSIINPEYLEQNMYPYMFTTAVTKMKHWVHLNLKDEQRSEEFYKYYSDKDFEFIMTEFLKIVHKVSPKHFKLLCEKSPKVAKVFFDLLVTNEIVKSRYIKNERNYYNSIKCLLKTDTNLFLDITEKYFNNNRFDRFSSIATKFVMSHHKDRFWKKPELYTAWILDMDILAESLNVEEAKGLVEMLARAQYIKTWFEFQKIEPLIKRLKPEDRAAFKKKIFVHKDIGENVKDWPYKPPSAPLTEDSGPDIFEDEEHKPYEYARMGKKGWPKKGKVMKRCIKGHRNKICAKIKTMLDKLFDEYRFVSFDKTFYELKKRILTESSAQNRQFIMLVLISKTGGRANAIATLMELLSRHGNEPANLRAAIIRSLVKRAFIWRLPEDTWNKLLQFGQGLGLDGNLPEADCEEGLHCVFIRSLLQNGTCNKAIFDAFLNNFSDLSAYLFTPAEKKCISEALPKILLSTAKEKLEVKDAVALIHKLIKVLGTYKIKVETYFDLIPTVVCLAEKDNSACSDLLEKLFNAKEGRKALFRFTYKLIKTDASHVNVLKHDINVLDFDLFYGSCLDGSKFNSFSRRLAIYFNENGGLAMQYCNKLKEKEHNKLIGRPLVILLGSELGAYLHELDKEEKVESKVLAATVRASVHMARPCLDIDTFGWRKAGVKLIVNKLLTCPSVDVKNNIGKLLEWKRTARLALVLSNRIENVTDVFVAVAKLRPTFGIKIGIKLLRKQGDNYDAKVWDTIKPLIEGINFTKNENLFYIQKVLSDVDYVPIKIRPEYNIIIFKAFVKAEELSYPAMPYLCRIENLLPNVSEDFIETILSQFLEKYFILEKNTDDFDEMLCKNMYLRIIFKYIYMSKSEEVQKRRFKNFGKKVFERMAEMFNFTTKKNDTFYKHLDEIMLNFKNTKVFMNSEYVSCLPVMENFVSWLQTILPIEENFDKYATIHLTMLYEKTLRLTMKQAPDVFKDEKRRYKEGVKVVGNLYGKYIAKEVKKLIEKYFESIIYIYTDALASFLNYYFNYVQSSDFMSSIIKGILEEGKYEVRLGMYLLKDKYYTVGEEIAAEINSSIRQVKDPKSVFFAFAEVCE